MQQKLAQRGAFIGKCKGKIARRAQGVVGPPHGLRRFHRLILHPAENGEDGRHKDQWNDPEQPKPIRETLGALRGIGRHATASPGQRAPSIGDRRSERRLFFDRLSKRSATLHRPPRYKRQRFSYRPA